MIPALNEALRIREVVEGALAQCPNVIVIDDGSDDGTADCIADLPVILLRHEQRHGQGRVPARRLREALRRGFDGVLTMDGDGQHRADDIPRLLEAAQPPSRRARHRRAPAQARAAADAIAASPTSSATGASPGAAATSIADSQSGQRFYPAEVCALDDVPGEDFVFEAQILISAARELGTRCVSVPIESRYQGPGSRRAVPRQPFPAAARLVPHHLAHRRAVLRYGDVAAEYRRIRANPPVIDDPERRVRAQPPRPLRLHAGTPHERAAPTSSSSAAASPA